MKSFTPDLTILVVFLIVGIASIFSSLIIYSNSLAALENKDCAATQPVAGTVWSGKDSDGDDYVYRFLESGVVDYSSPNGRFTNGRWKQTCDKITFHMNKHYSDYEGKIRGPIMKGEAENIKGHQWWWRAARQ